MWSTPQDFEDCGRSTDDKMIGDDPIKPSWEVGEYNIVEKYGDVGKDDRDEIYDSFDDELEDIDFSLDHEESIEARQNLKIYRQKKDECRDVLSEENLSLTMSMVSDDDSGYKSTYEDSDSSIASLSSDNEGAVMFRNKKLKVKTYSKACDHKALTLEIGMKFKDIKECKWGVRQWAIVNGYNIRWKRSGGTKLEAACIGNCSWRLYASKLTREPTCVIRSCDGKHTCIRTNENQQANSKWLADIYKEKLIRNPFYDVKEMVREVQINYGVIVSDMSCRRAKWKIQANMRGTYNEHYSKLRSYVAMLKKQDKEGRFELKTYLDCKSQPVFQRIYIGFSAPRKGFLIGCRKAIGFDACFLKASLGGSLISAVSKDCNQKMYPLAWAVVEKETEESWSWFFEILFQELYINDGFGWTFMSDKQKGLINSIQKLTPNAEHRHCARHIYANWKKMFGGPKYKGLFWEVVKSSNRSQYTYKLNQLRAESSDAYNEFCKRGPESFCKALISSFTKTDIIDNNISECFNSYILKAREKPLIEMLEDIRKRLMSRMCVIAKDMEASDDILCPNIRKKMDKIQNAARFCELVPAVGGKFEVHVYDESYIVDLQTRECSCRAWELTGIPCCHAVACIFYTRQKPEVFVDHFFYKSNCVETYKHGLTPMLGQREWLEVHQPPILPPEYTKPSGRPKKNRIRDQFEERKSASSNNDKMKRIMKMTCSKCGKIGHNKRSCKEEYASVSNNANGQGKHGTQRATPAAPPRVRVKRVVSTEARATELREKRLTNQGLGVRMFSESGNVWMKAPGGRRVHFVSGAREATAADSNISSERAQFDNATLTTSGLADGCSQNSQVESNNNVL